MQAAYDEIAEWYDQSVRQGALLSGTDLIASACFDLMGILDGRSICDLACGQGDMSRQMAGRGAKVVGIDISGKLLEIARREEEAEPLSIRYVHGDAQDMPILAEAPFDGVLSNLALMDIPDLSATFRCVSRILRPSGWFVFSITHPCFQSPPGRSYFEEGFWRSDNPNGVRGQVGAHHRALSTYLSALGAEGLLVEKAAEPLLPGRETPPVLVLRCRRSPLPASATFR